MTYVPVDEHTDHRRRKVSARGRALTKAEARALDTSPEERRRQAIQAGFGLLGAALLRDQRPSEDNLFLLIFAVAEAATARDHAALGLANESLLRLRRYLDADASPHLAGELSSLQRLTWLAAFCLDDEPL